MSKIQKFLICIAIVSLVVFVAVGCGGNDNAENKNTEKENAGETEVIKAKMVGTLPVGHHLTDALHVFKDYVEEKSGGKVEIDLYPAQQLYNDKDLVNVMPKGAVDLAIANMDMWTGMVTSAGILYMPTLFDDKEHFFRVARGKVGDAVKEQIQEKCNCKILGWVDYGTADMIFKEPVVKLEDFKGKRIRAFGQYISYFEEGIGAAPTMMSSSEVYQALQKGTLDGAMSGLTSFNSRKWYEVAKHVPDVHLAPVIPFMTVVNLDFWKSLSEDVQKIFLEGAQKIEEFTRKEVAKETQESKNILKENGVEFHEITDEEIARWREAALPLMMEKYKENYDPKKAQEMLDTVEALR